MSHELRDNQLRRQEIIDKIPDDGLSIYDTMSLIMSFGYNQRGADNKLRELQYLRLIEEKKGKIFRRTHK